MDDTEFFDSEKLVATYRKVIGQLEDQTTPEGKAEYEKIAAHLREEWEGDDALHEMAFGEPE